MIDVLKKTHGHLVSAELKAWATHYKDTLKELDVVAKEIRSWTVSTMEAATTVLELLASNLQQQSAKLMGAINKVKLDINQGASEKYKATHAEVAVRERAIRSFVAMGTPGVLAKWLFANRGILPVKSPSMKAVIGRSRWP